MPKHLRSQHAKSGIGRGVGLPQLVETYGNTDKTTLERGSDTPLTASRTLALPFRGGHITCV